MASTRLLAPEPAAPRRHERGGAFAALGRPTYWSFWLSSWAWNIARWLGLFTASYLISHRGGSTLAVQLVGAAFFAPMFVGGLAGGIIADRLDRRRVLMLQLWVLVALGGVLGADLIAGTASTWHIYPAMVVLGFGSVADMTCRRALVHDLVGAELLTNAFALESISMTGGTMLGNLAAGAIIAWAGTGQAFAAMGLLCGLAALLLLRVHAVQQHRAAPGPVSIRGQTAEAFRFALRHRPLLGVLAVTVIMNAFFYTYTPLVPAFANRLGVGALAAGALGSASGMGSLVGAFFIAGKRLPLRRVQIYAGGTALGLAGLIWFAASGAYAPAFAALLVAGIGAAGFGTMQSALVVSIAPGELRGRAMGVLSMAIGSLPFAMLALGAIAERAGMTAAVRGSGVAGLVCLAACWAAARSLRGIE